MAGLARIIGEELHRDELTAERHSVALNEAHVRALLAALEARDGYTEEHSHAVVEMALLVFDRGQPAAMQLEDFLEDVPVPVDRVADRKRATVSKIGSPC